ncbi:MAG: PaaI family thioesterase [Pseudomonadota bacterium]
MTETPVHLYPEDQQFGQVPMELAATLSGMEVYERMMSGDLPPPPMYRIANVRLLSAEPGRTTLEAVPLEDHYNPIGTVHGGWIATLLDAALASCVHTQVPTGSGFTTVEFKTNLVRPVSVSTGRLICEGTVLHMGRTIATSEARIMTEAGKMVAHGVETCAIFEIPGR